MKKRHTSAICSRKSEFKTSKQKQFPGCFLRSRESFFENGDKMKHRSSNKKFRKPRITSYWNRTYKFYVRTKHYRDDTPKPRSVMRIIRVVLFKSARTGHADVASAAKVLQFFINLPLITVFEIYDEVLLRRELNTPHTDFSPQDSFRRIERFYRVP